MNRGLLLGTHVNTVLSNMYGPGFYPASSVALDFVAYPCPSMAHDSSDL